MRRYLVFASVSLALILSAISSSSVAVAFPVITSTFSASLVLAGWVLSSYQLINTAAMPLAGKAGDVFGRKIVFIISLFLFTLGSLMSALSPNIWFLIIGRFVQGLGGGGFMPIAAGVVADDFPRSRQRAIGLFSSIHPLGQIIGPNLGGWLVHSFGWQSVFWLNIPLGLVVLLSAVVLLKPGRTEEGQLDARGAGWLMGALFAFMTGISLIGEGGGSWLFAILLLGASVLFMVAFLRHEKKARNPIIDIEMLQKKPFIATNVYNFILGSAAFGLFSFVPLYAVSIYGMSTFESGLVLTPRSIGMVVASTVTSIFLVRWGYRKPMLVGASLIIVSLLLLAVGAGMLPGIRLPLSGFALVGTATLISGLGMGITMPAANNACIELMPHRIASITGLRGMFRQIGGSVSIAMTTLFLHYSATISRGFLAVFLSVAFVYLLIIPLIFLMPRSPEVAAEPARATS